MFRTVPLPIIRRFLLYTQQWFTSYRFADSLRAGCRRTCMTYTIAKPVPSWSCSQAVNKIVWHIPLLCVQWETPDDGQRNGPKHIDLHSKNKFEKLVHLVGFIIRTYCLYMYLRLSVLGRVVVWIYFNFSSDIAVITLRAKFNLLSAVPSIELHPQHIVPVSKTVAVSMASATTTSIWATFWNNETVVAGRGGEDDSTLDRKRRSKEKHEETCEHMGI